MKASSRIVAAIAAVVAAHGDHDQKTIEGPHQGIWYNTLPGDGGTQV
jgi:agmatinase